MLKTAALPLPILALCLLTAAPAPGAEGRVEINQVVVDAAGGFPFTISEPGSYVLTGPLVVPADTDGIIVAANEVTLDLNGFSITGAAVCGNTVCAAGTGSAIRPMGLFTGTNFSTVHNGVVRGFGGDCIRMLSAAQVRDVAVSECGGRGISVHERSVVTRCRVDRTGQEGIAMRPSAVYAHNAIADAGLGGGDDPAVSGGRPSAGNSCDDPSCSVLPRRRFYLTFPPVDGDHGGDDCAPGFHMASIFELMNPSVLEYAADGVTPLEAGPVQSNGWVYAGGVNQVFHCSDGAFDPWSSSSGVEQGATARLEPIGAQGGPHWQTELRDCNESWRIWCIED